MRTLTVTAKGQVILPKDILEHLGVHPGDKIIADKLSDGRIELKVDQPARKISNAFGFLKGKRKGQTQSVKDMNETVVRGWARKR